MKELNEFEKISGYQTTKMIADILSGKTPDVKVEPQVMDKTDKDINAAVQETYRKMMSNPKDKGV